MKKLIFFYFFNVLIFGITSCTKNNVVVEKKIDSENSLIDSLNKLGKKYWTVNIDSTNYFGGKAYDLSIKRKYDRGVIESCINLAVVNDLKNNPHQSLQYRKRAYNLSNEKGILQGKTSFSLGNYYVFQRNNDSATFYYKKAEFFFEKDGDNESLANVYNNISNVLDTDNNFRESINYYFKAINIYNNLKAYDRIPLTYTNIGIVYYSLGDIDLAEKYFKIALFSKYATPQAKAISYNNLGNVYNIKNKKEEALTYFKNSLEEAKKMGDVYTVDKTRLNIATILSHDFKKKEEVEKIMKEINIKSLERQDLKILYDRVLAITQMNNGNLNKSFELVGKSMESSKEIKNDLLYIDGYPLYQEILSKNLKDKQVYDNFVKYDSIIKQRSRKNIINISYDLNQKYKTAEKESQIKSQQLEIEKQKANRNLAFGGIGMLGLLGLGGAIYTRNRNRRKELENKNSMLTLRQNLNEMELQSLNKQLDPHEIKNLLASISPEIQTKAPEAYKKMVKLLNLTKSSLNNNSLTENIDTQIQQIHDYLSLEKNTLSVPLNYSIENNIEKTDVEVPRLLLKNLVENSIKHGIRNKENGGDIIVKVTQENGHIKILVGDNGIGRKQSISKDTGIGISTYQKLFETLNEKNVNKASLNITDKEQGTEVVVEIPVNYRYS